MAHERRRRSGRRFGLRNFIPPFFRRRSRNNGSSSESRKSGMSNRPSSPQSVLDDLSSFAPPPPVSTVEIDNDHDNHGETRSEMSPVTTSITILKNTDNNNKNNVFTTERSSTSSSSVHSDTEGNNKNSQHSGSTNNEFLSCQMSEASTAYFTEEILSNLPNDTNNVDSEKCTQYKKSQQNKLSLSSNIANNQLVATPISSNPFDDQVKLSPDRTVSSHSVVLPNDHTDSGFNSLSSTAAAAVVADANDLSIAGFMSCQSSKTSTSEMSQQLRRQQQQQQAAEAQDINEKNGAIDDLPIIMNNTLSSIQNDFDTTCESNNTAFFSIPKSSCELIQNVAVPYSLSLSQNDLSEPLSNDTGTYSAVTSIQNDNTEDSFKFVTTQDTTINKQSGDLFANAETEPVETESKISECHSNEPEPTIESLGGSSNDNEMTQQDNLSSPEANVHRATVAMQDEQHHHHQRHPDDGYGTVSKINQTKSGSDSHYEIAENEDMMEVNDLTLSPAFMDVGAIKNQLVSQTTEKRVNIPIDSASLENDLSESLSNDTGMYSAVTSMQNDNTDNFFEFVTTQDTTINKQCGTPVPNIETEPEETESNISECHSNKPEPTIELLEDSSSGNEMTQKDNLSSPEAQDLQYRKLPGHGTNDSGNDSCNNNSDNNDNDNNNNINDENTNVLPHWRRALTEGAHVCVIDGPYSGSHGQIVGFSQKRVIISIDGANYSLYPTSIVKVEEGIDTSSSVSVSDEQSKNGSNQQDPTAQNDETMQENLPVLTTPPEGGANPLLLSENNSTNNVQISSTLSQRTSQNGHSGFFDGDHVKIIRGTYNGSRGIITGFTPKKIKVSIDNVIRTLMPTSLQQIRRQVFPNEGVNYAALAVGINNTSVVFSNIVASSSGESIAQPKCDTDGSTNSVTQHAVNNDITDTSQSTSTASVTSSLTHQSNTFAEPNDVSRTVGQEGASFNIGDKVIVTSSGECHGLSGLVTEITPKRIKVHVGGKNRNFKSTSLQLETKNNPIDNTNSTAGPIATNQSVTNQNVRAIRPSSVGSNGPTQSADVVGVCRSRPQSKVASRQSSTPRTRKKAKQNDDDDDDLFAGLSNVEWKFPGSETPLQSLQFGNHRLITRVRAECEEAASTKVDTFVRSWLGHRIQFVDIPINGVEKKAPIETELEAGGVHYSLVSAKILDDSEGSNFQYSKSKKLQLVYAAIDGPNIEPCSLQEKLEDLGDFGSLSPRKVASRLELLMSPALRSKEFDPFRPLPIEYISEIPENGNEGCGFICEELLVKLLYRVCTNKANAKRAVAIQVRIIAPKFGIFKGMLFKKKMDQNEAKIQLPPSMKKVGPSKTDHADQASFILFVTKQGLHQNSTNHMVGRLLNPDPKSKVPPKSFKPKKLSDMISRLWTALGVPKPINKAYCNRCTDKMNLKHAFVVGVADPTNMIPPGTVYITGLCNGGQDLDRIFCTRSPCVEPCDGRMLKFINNSKPTGMPIDTWNWLESLTFGAIIFGNPLHGEPAIPTMIAGGDLDGDLYFICWEKQVLDHIQAEELPTLDTTIMTTTAASSSSTTTSTTTSTSTTIPNYTMETNNNNNVVKPPAAYDPNWLQNGQQVMTNLPQIMSLQMAIGKLFNLSIKAANNDEENFMYNQDCLAYARAYKEALDLGKHGGIVHLPKDLHRNIPNSLHCLLQDTENNQD